MEYPRHLSYTTPNQRVFATKLSGTHSLSAVLLKKIILSNSNVRDTNKGVGYEFSSQS